MNFKAMLLRKNLHFTISFLHLWLWLSFSSLGWAGNNKKIMEREEESFQSQNY